MDRLVKETKKKKDDVKIVAFHLPQYHTFPENDKWWGKGFTEWVNVKKAIPQFRGHQQPRIPMDDNYYDLSKEQVLLDQMKMAREYGISAFCFYHYWFDGKLLLEKPLEHLLNMKEKPIDYFFCWANEPWTRSWDGRSKDVIMPQRYGDETDWELHFKYLLPFFKQENYVKEDGCPVLVLYRSNNVPNCDEMVAYWNKRCIDEGFEGIYLVEEFNSFQNKSHCENSRAIVEFEPMNSISNNMRKIERIPNFIRGKLKKTEKLNYDKIWNKIISQRHDGENKKVFLGAFVDWDNTPRRGKRGLVIRGASPEKFRMYLERQIEKSKLTGTRYIFINAWNEWGEGAYLEPDEMYLFAYLEAIQKCLK